MRSGDTGNHPCPGRGDDGYALIVALIAMLAFSLLAYEVLAGSRGNTAVAGAEIERARLTAAADAGLAQAISNLATRDATVRWPIDGRAQNLTFDGIALKIVVEDERGKVPINLLTEDQYRSLLEIVGVSGERLDTLVDSFEDWIDDDDDKRTNGAELRDYAPLGYAPRNGAVRTLDEMLMVHGMDAALYERLKPSLTVFFGESGGFSTDTSQPLALAVMSGGGLNSPQVIERERELGGERPALDIADQKPLTGRTLTVRVLATDGSSGQLLRSAIIELTGNPKQPYWIRERED